MADENICCVEFLEVMHREMSTDLESRHDDDLAQAFQWAAEEIKSLRKELAAPRLDKFRWMQVEQEGKDARKKVAELEQTVMGLGKILAAGAAP